MFRSLYSVFCLFVNVHCITATGCQPNCGKIIIIIIKRLHAWTWTVHGRLLRLLTSQQPNMFSLPPTPCSLCCLPLKRYVSNRETASVRTVSLFMSKHFIGRTHHSVTYLNDQGITNIILACVKKISPLRYNERE
jgi:hypothetical protein